MARPTPGTSSRTLLLVLLLALLGAALGWQQGWMAWSPAPPLAAPRPPTPPPFRSAWATEQEWLVDRITRDVREMAALAAGKALPPTDAPATRPEAIRFDPHLFSPRSYASLAREALGPEGALAPSALDAQQDTALIASLLEPTAPVLASSDVALSRELEASPGLAGPHERAALLLGAFALRDCAGRSTDPRPALTRMTAHLALARALGGDREPGLAARFAEAVLATLVGRERDALARLDLLAGAAPGPAERAWLRALRLRNTADWRMAQADKRLTLLEELEQFRALVISKDDNGALAWLDEREPRPLPDWGRLALSQDSYSMGTLNRFADASLLMDMAEAAEVLTTLHASPADMSGFFEVVNQEPGGSVRRDSVGKGRVFVLGEGLWTHRIQRNLVFDLEMGDRRRFNLNLPGERRAYAEQSRQRFSRLAMFPIAMRVQADDAESYRTAMAAVRELALRSPERLTGGHWQLIRQKLDFADLPKDLPDPNTWFRPALPKGTLFAVAPRLELVELAAIEPSAFAALRDEAPYNVALALLASRYLRDADRSTAPLAVAFGPLAEYNLTIMGKLSDAAWYEPDEFRKRQGRLCELDATYCLGLGYRLAELGFSEEAATAYQRAFDHAPDQVLLANNSRWLVDYYFDHGETAKAEAVARQAAETYSGPGLFALARLLERMGRLREAEDYYRRMHGRYDNAGPLAGFYYRQTRAGKAAAYETKLKDAMAIALPRGLEPFDRSSLPPKPTDGVVFRGANDNTKRFGIQWGNVIVALDGFRVRDYETYDVISDLDQSSRMKLVIWRGQSYDDVDVELWDRRFRVDLETLGSR